jgi:hypothetical protein
MIVSGTDYNASEDTSLYSTIELFGRYCNESTMEMSFSDWLFGNTDYIRDRNALQHVSNMFDLNEFASKYTNELRAVVSNAPFQNKLIQMRKLREIMEKNGFIFMFMSSHN